jgi:hypothetical protein
MAEITYLEDGQVKFIEQLEALLNEAREGKIVGCTLIKLDASYYLESDSLGCAPDDISLVSALHAMAAETTAQHAVETAVDMLFNELADDDE